MKEQERYSLITASYEGKEYEVFADRDSKGNIPMGSYWVYDNPNTIFDGVITKNNLPQEWFDKLHDKEFYFIIIASKPALPSLPLLEIVEGEDEIKLSMEATKGKVFANGIHEEVVAQIYFRKGYKAATSSRRYGEKEMANFAKWLANECTCEKYQTRRASRTNDAEFSHCGDKYYHYETEQLLSFDEIVKLYLSTISTLTVPLDEQGNPKIENINGQQVLIVTEK